METAIQSKKIEGESKFDLESFRRPVKRPAIDAEDFRRALAIAASGVEDRAFSYCAEQAAYQSLSATPRLELKWLQ
jgi:hypothetical protein